MQLAWELQLNKRLTAERESYDYIILDTPPYLDTMTIMSLVAADEVIVAIDPSCFPWPVSTSSCRCSPTSRRSTTGSLPTLRAGLSGRWHRDAE